MRYVRACLLFLSDERRWLHSTANAVPSTHVYTRNRHAKDPPSARHRPAAASRQVQRAASAIAYPMQYP